MNSFRHTSVDAHLFISPLLIPRMFYVLLNSFESYQQLQAPIEPRPVFHIYLKVKYIIENQKWGAINARLSPCDPFLPLKKMFFFCGKLEKKRNLCVIIKTDYMFYILIRLGGHFILFIYLKYPQVIKRTLILWFNYITLISSIKTHKIKSMDVFNQKQCLLQLH